MNPRVEMNEVAETLRLLVPNAAHVAHARAQITPAEWFRSKLPAIMEELYANGTCALDVGGDMEKSFLVEGVFTPYKGYELSGRDGKIVISIKKLQK